VAAVADPLGGSYYVEALTDRMESEAQAYIDKIDAMGGMVRAVEEGFPQREIAASAYRFQKQVDAGERTIVGINKYRSEEAEIPTLKIDPNVERDQAERARATRKGRDDAAAKRHIEAVRNAAASDDNLFDPILAAVRDGVTLGEVCQVFREVFGEFREPAYL
jgi:methylmalonyl-CoA mutase N-terminal domain/subunit